MRCGAVQWSMMVKKLELMQFMAEYQTDGNKSVPSTMMDQVYTEVPITKLQEIVCGQYCEFPIFHTLLNNFQSIALPKQYFKMSVQPLFPVQFKHESVR